MSLDVKPYKVSNTSKRGSQSSRRSISKSEYYRCKAHPDDEQTPGEEQKEDQVVDKKSKLTERLDGLF